MGNKARSASKERRKKSKANQKATQKARYQTYAASGDNSKRKNRMRRAGSKWGTVRAKMPGAVLVTKYSARELSDIAKRTDIFPFTPVGLVQYSDRIAATI